MRIQNNRAVLGACLLAIGMLDACAAGEASGRPPQFRSTQYGAVIGVDDAAQTGTYNWKGVPFARPPVGPLRWKAPAEPEAWTEPLPTTRFGNACIQNGRIYGPGANNSYDATIGTTLNTPLGKEDCLTLNIWRPASAADNLPVLLFLHGGSNISGYTADPVYDGAALAKFANAVVVTANYRLGVFGFLELAQLKGGPGPADASGNFALLDNIRALQFLQANIAQFGGDPHNVTLMGQSAGAINVWALLTSPLTAGLFHKAVPLSGGLALASNLAPGALPTLNPAASYAAQGNGLLHQLLVADGKAADLAGARAYAASQSAAQIAAFLRGQDAGTILATVLAKGLGASGPIPDGSVVPFDPIAAIGAGNYRNVPVLAGNTAEEGKLFQALFALRPNRSAGFRLADAQRMALMMHYQADAAPATTLEELIDPSFLPADTAGTGYHAAAAFFTKQLFLASRDKLLDGLKQRQATVWYYQFAWAQEPAPWNLVYGAAHGFDLPFLFHNFGPSLFSGVVNSRANAPGRLALSQAMMGSLAAFARHGNPNHDGLGVTWQPWPQRLIFDATPSARRISVQ